ncbi:hypothetical protein KIPB_005033 [Kipferlia bialata]|uniref:DUF4485 domain-containing protein n=1 Tax=Kipferlia bialata TaxID=797122 RepID=A0A9K3CWE6_9EUKA|nr:hypothetical protein KIPB_005033 [Kipferlia bialata]|eukprot:g5033.t1
MPESNSPLDRHFRSILFEIEREYVGLPTAQRIIVERWVLRLNEPQKLITWKKNRNLYAQLLLHFVRKGKLEKPFNRRPPDGSLPNVPKYMTMHLKGEAKRRKDAERQRAAPRESGRVSDSFRHSQTPAKERERGRQERQSPAAPSPVPIPMAPPVQTFPYDGRHRRSIVASRGPSDRPSQRPSQRYNVGGSQIGDRPSSLRHSQMADGEEEREIEEREEERQVQPRYQGRRDAYQEPSVPQRQRQGRRGVEEAARGTKSSGALLRSVRPSTADPACDVYSTSHSFLETEREIEEEMQREREKELEREREEEEREREEREREVEPVTMAHHLSDSVFTDSPRQTRDRGGDAEGERETLHTAPGSLASLAPPLRSQRPAAVKRGGEREGAQPRRVSSGQAARASPPRQVRREEEREDALARRVRELEDELARVSDERERFKRLTDAQKSRIAELEREVMSQAPVADTRRVLYDSGRVEQGEGEREEERREGRSRRRVNLYDQSDFIDEDCGGIGDMEGESEGEEWDGGVHTLTSSRGPATATIDHRRREKGRARETGRDTAAAGGPRRLMPTTNSPAMVPRRRERERQRERDRERGNPTRPSRPASGGLAGGVDLYDLEAYHRETLSLAGRGE